MLKKAVQDHNPVVSGLKGTTSSQNYNATANTLKPRPSSILNTAYPTPANALKRTASQASDRASPFSSQDQGLKKAMMSLTQPLTGGRRLDNLHDPVFFDENDFEDDQDIDLDAEDIPIARRSTSSGASSSTLLPDPPQTESAAPQASANSTPLAWSSSPLSHHQMPPPKPPASIAATANTCKRRTLPWIEDQKKADQARREKSDRLCEGLTGGVPPTASEQAIMDQKKERKERKLLDRQCTDLTGGERGPANRRQSTTGGERELDGYRQGMLKKGMPDWIVDKVVQGKKRKIETAQEASGKTYTPLPKDKANSPYPWNKTASAVKEEQKRLRQGHKKLVKDNEGGSEKSDMKKKGRETVAKVFLSEEQTSVLNLVAEQKKSVFFTGSAGTGKSVLLREIIKVLRDKHKREPDQVAVTASTGLAACNVGGVTLHSFAGIGLGKEAVPELVKKIKRNAKAKMRWLRTKVLIVDEISMVDGDLFDKLEAIARAIRNNGRPFGGIQLVITGDFFQLPPVPDYGRVSKFSFDAATWNTSIEHTIGLTQVFRQKDPVFANMLNEMRLGRLTPKSVDAFRALNRPLSFADDFEATELFPTRNEVEYANTARMRNLSGREFEFKAVDGGCIVDHAQRDKLLANCMAPASISLKKGAQVMLIKNIDDSLVNGSVGKVVAFMDEKTFDIYHEDEDEFQAVETMELNDEEMTASRKKLKAMIDKDLPGSTSQKWPLVRFALSDGSSRDLLCQQESWKIELPSGEVQASRMQVPLILAWALSIHKAQGQTLDRVKVDLGKIFEKGQAYVALSRATCQEGLQITRFDPKKVMAHDRVRTFYDSLYSVAKPTTSQSVDRNPGISAKAHERDFIDSAYGIDSDEEQAMYA